MLSNIGITLLISIVVSYVLVLLVQNIRSQVKLFLLIAILVLFYSVAKMFHLSSLLIVLVFGLVLRNRQVFFFGPLRKLIKEDSMKDIFKDFNMITMESSFMLRTFFFVIFGITISISALFDNLVILISFGILAIIYGIRWLWLRIVLRKDFNTQLFLAPRGLITILLFFAIPKEFQISEFNEGILLFVIIFSSLIMAGALMRNSKKKEIVEEIETPIEGDSQEVEVTE
jgi:NhaP-type Na+/H+ or K+/H+ antiporter